jgi:hypothetical protein
MTSDSLAIDLRDELIDALKADVIRVGAERDAALADAERLRSGIRQHRDQKFDDRCWLDDRCLYDLLPEGGQYVSGLPPKAEFLRSCERYWAQRQCPTDVRGIWAGHPMTIAQLEGEVERIRPDAARLDLLESKLVRAVWVECGRGRLFRLTMTDGRSFEAKTARGAIDAAMEGVTLSPKGNDDECRT